MNGTKWKKYSDNMPVRSSNFFLVSHTSFFESNMIHKVIHKLILLTIEELFKVLGICVIFSYKKKHSVNFMFFFYFHSTHFTFFQSVACTMECYIIVRNRYQFFDIVSNLGTTDSYIWNYLHPKCRYIILYLFPVDNSEIFS